MRHSSQIVEQKGRVINVYIKKLVIIWLIILLIIAGVITMWFFTEKRDATEIIDSYIIEKGYEDYILEKEITYDWKLGTYFATVTFEDEPEIYYEFYPESKGVHVTGYSKDQNEEVTNREKAKYIEDN